MKILRRAAEFAHVATGIIFSLTLALSRLGLGFCCVESQGSAWGATLGFGAEARFIAETLQGFARAIEKFAIGVNECEVEFDENVSVLQRR